MKTFEYEIFSASFEHQSEVVDWYNSLGSDGWEIIHLREQVQQTPFSLTQWATCKKELTVELCSCEGITRLQYIDNKPHCFVCGKPTL